jgi:8-oxo-dGTP diphosphatase
MAHLSLPLDLWTGNKGDEVNETLPKARELEKKPTMTVVAAALLDGEGRVLLQQRAPGRAMAGLWEFPGGKVEERELPEAALARELAEELGIGTRAADLVPACFASARVGERHMLLLLYLCRTWRGEPEALDASALLWATPAEMAALAMPPADAPLIPLLDALLRAGAA